MTEQEMFLFDLWGYVVLENVLDSKELQNANEAIDHNASLIADREPTLSGGASELIGRTGRGEFLQNPLSFDRPWCDPFRAMLTHKRTIAIFNEILGSGYRLDHGPGLIRMVKDTEGHKLHGGMTFDPCQYHNFINGRIHCGLCVAAWQLTDVSPGDGGFACIPGSHKSNFRPPGKVITLQEDWGCVQQVVAPAGSVIIFNEALVHGTLPWQPTNRERRSILFKFSPGFLSYGSPQKNPIGDPTPEEIALYEFPSRNGRTELMATNL